MMCLRKSLKRKLFAKEHWIFWTITIIGLVFIYEPTVLKFQDVFYGTDMPRGWTHNTTRDVRVFVDSGETKFIINPTNTCSENDVYLLVIVCSAVQNFEARQAIRKTWGNTTILDNMVLPPVRVLFILGKSNNFILNSGVNMEGLQYNDIIQENFYDSYNNLTLKSLGVLNWATTHCKSAKYVMKTDDDMWVNVVNLLMSLIKIPRGSETLMGAVFPNTYPVLDSTNKWYVPKFLFSGRRFPTYLSGTGYVMSLDVAAKLHEAALSSPLIHIEDVFVTGICAKAAGIKHTDHDEFFKQIQDMDDECSMLAAVTIHLREYERIIIVWEKLKKIFNDLSTVDRVCEKRTPFLQLLLNY